MSPKRPTAPSLTRVRVPQPLELVSTHNATFAVAFKVHRKAGVSVRDVLSGKATVDGHNERVFEQTGVRQFRLVIDWPGYDQAGAYVSVREDGAFITRGELAKRVCKSIQKFMQKKAGDEWTIARDRGQRGITIDKLWLVRVLPTARNMWMAELEVQM
ncbi:hypothetical protein BD309DRAFT_993358 [Dichomitus squalens]|uniref:Uncharacterized protein n=1 Tax=Dichomitus squalens TaxID=114155 RepID=A0A4Q9PIS6_9APHY|nr:hypothetical protein BD309DRAFT_993358 [Dichomitus squalens]TBU53964.1 hypothetical protein BD310DRAFT_951772 [Dichomitus squalens]